MSDDHDEGIPAHTTPTWEMELLVSGATIFGLLQLPELLDHGYFRVVNLVPDSYARLMLPFWLYSKIAVVTLVLTFIAHLCLRGYWVALVGLNSVFPGGIRWDRLGLGPIARERFAARAEDMPAVIERADNRATRVFGVGFSFAMLMLAPMLLALLAMAASVVVSAVIGGEHTVDVLFVLAGLVLLPWILATMLDRRFGARLEQWPRVAGLVAAVTDLYGRVGVGPRGNPLTALFASHTGRRRFAVIALLVIMPVALAITMQITTQRGELPFGLSSGLSASDPFSSTTSPNAFYADERGDGFVVRPLPHIRSRVVDGPYVELFVPFITRLHGAALPLACPGLGDSDSDGRRRLDCLASMLRIELDGTAIAVPLDASTDVSTGQPGMLAMIPVAELPPGRHELSLNEPDHRTVDDSQPRRYRIPFWK